MDAETVLKILTLAVAGYIGCRWAIAHEMRKYFEVEEEEES